MWQECGSWYELQYIFDILIVKFFLLTKRSTICLYRCKSYVIAIIFLIKYMSFFWGYSGSILLETRFLNECFCVGSFEKVPCSLRLKSCLRVRQVDNCRESFDSKKSTEYLSNHLGFEWKTFGDFPFKLRGDLAKATVAEIWSASNTT